MSQRETASFFAGVLLTIFGSDLIQSLIDGSPVLVHAIFFGGVALAWFVYMRKRNPEMQDDQTDAT